MSWTVASFTILFLALSVGFGWYERSAPSTKVLALVATLAALAAIGRVAFAPLPNVKPTTDIVLLSGYVLGGPPGFAVGAVAALASNIFFGQGPWTPFQMGAWGLCGIFGATLAVLSRRGMGRWSLALCCGLAGLGFGAIMDFQTWVSLSGSHTFAQYGVISGVSLSYNVAHAVGNVVFCLAFGPGFVRALQRFRTRMSVRWEPAVPASVAAARLPVAGIVAVLAVAVATLAIGPGGGTGPLGADTAGAAASAASRTSGYLQRARNPDGGWGAAKGQSSTALHTAWSAIGLGAAGRSCPSRTVTFIRRAASRQSGAGDLERSILALRACGIRARDSKGRVLLRVLRSRQRPDGSVSGLTNQTAFFLFALRAGGAGTADGGVKRAGRFVAAQQNADGGFNFARKGGASGIDDTAAALQAIIAAGRGGRAVSRAAAFLRARQNRDGGFPLSPSAPSNAQSTAFAVQALVAAKVNVDRVRRGGSRPPLGYLGSLIQRDGSVRYSRTIVQTPVWVTAQALVAFARRPFPFSG
ncbi:MAG: Prenyltransferase/squalene oxidase [Solirubrobacterales bacterium]|nr:Prenyltransferase/squalene oxidase [Solirubrobacterales bacterium]